MRTHFIRRTLLGGIAGVAVTLLSPSPSHAVLLYRSPTRNTTAPTGVYANSGWQYQGQFHNILGTPVAPHWFVTALHAGGVNTFTYKGVNYNVDTSFVGSGPGWINGPHSDLRLWKVQEAFPDWAPMWDETVDGSEVGRDMVAFGRGTQRGAPVYGLASAPRDGMITPGTRPPVTELKGWAVGPADTVQSWGANTVESIFDASQFDLGDLVTFDFDRNSPLSEECNLSNGDSGGAVFTKSPGGTWKLSGINFSVDGPFRVRPTSENFLGAMFDEGGLYIADDPVFQVPDSAADVPGYSYASRISSNLGWIRSIIGNPGNSPITSAPEPTTGAIALLGMAGAALRRRRRR